MGNPSTDHGPYYQAVEWKQSKKIISAIEKNFTKFSSASQLKVLDLPLALNQINSSKLKLEGVDTLFTALEAEVPTKQFITTLKSAAQDKSRELESPI